MHSTASSPPPHRRRHWRPVAAVALLMAPLVACTTAEQTAGSSTSSTVTSSVDTAPSSVGTSFAYTDAGDDSGVPTTADAAEQGELVDRVATPKLVWKACEDGFDCATATVPMDYGSPDGKQIDLALVRLPATDRDQRIGSLFVNPGGPGLPSTGFTRKAAPKTFPELVRKRFDIIGFDPRGVGRSTQVTCFDDPTERAVALSRTEGWPIGATEQAGFFRAATELAERCAKKSGELLDHLSTADVARDLDVLRRAVGDEQLNYFGLSYGSFLGATYASLFPDRVRAAVLDGVLEPTQYTGADAASGSLPWLRVGNDLATDEVLGQFFELCADAGKACPLGVDGNPRTKYLQLISALEKKPLVVPDTGYGTFTIGADSVGLLAFTQLGSPRLWTGLATVLNTLHRKLVVENDPTATLEYNLKSQTPDPDVPPSPVEEPAANQLEVYLANVCVDTDGPQNAEQIAAAAAEAGKRAPFAANRWAWVTTACSSWSGDDSDRYAGPFTPETSSPLLVVGNRHDPNTAYASSVSLAAELPSAGLLTLNGWGHTSSFQGYSACIDDAVAAYLVDGTMPAAGTECEPDPSAVPFATTK